MPDTERIDAGRRSVRRPEELAAAIRARAPPGILSLRRRGPAAVHGGPMRPMAIGPASRTHSQPPCSCPPAALRLPSFPVRLFLPRVDLMIDNDWSRPFHVPGGAFAQASIEAATAWCTRHDMRATPTLSHSRQVLYEAGLGRWHGQVVKLGWGHRSILRHVRGNSVRQQDGHGMDHGPLFPSLPKGRGGQLLPAPCRRACRRSNPRHGK